MSSNPVDCKECRMLNLIDENQSKTGPSKKLTKRGWTILGISGLAFGTFYAIATPFITPALRKICLPYVPATTKQVKNVVKLLKNSSSNSQKVIDLGSGDGRIVIDVAKQGYYSVGVELNPWLVFYSKWKSWRENVHRNTQFYTSDLWKVSLSGYDHVIIFGVEQMMPDLEKKLSKELDDQGQVLACRFPLPNWKPVLTIDEGIDSVWLYKKPQ